MTINDFHSPEYIIRQASMRVGDPDKNHGMSEGWYLTQVRRALDELSFDSKFQTLTVDELMPTTLQFEVPKNLFNIKEFYVYNGDCWSPSAAYRVWWKTEYNNTSGTPGGTNYTSGRMDNIVNNPSAPFDPFVPSFGIVGTYEKETIPYANIQNGIIMFGSFCSTFARFRIVYSGTFGSFDDKPCVPRFLTEAIIDFVCVEYCLMKLAEQPREYGTIYNALNSKANDPIKGTWVRARMRAANLDDWEKDALVTYYNRGNW